MGSLLLIDDELDILESLEELFKYEVAKDLDVYTANSARKAIELLDRIKFDVVMTDIRMPGMNGIELFRLIKKNWPRCRVVFLTGYKEFDYLYEVSEYKDVRYLLKSEEDSVIVRTVLEAFGEIEKMMAASLPAAEELSKPDKSEMWAAKEFINRIIRSGGSVERLRTHIESFGMRIEVDAPMLAFLFKIDPASQEELSTEEYDSYESMRRIAEHFMPAQLDTRIYLVANVFGLLLLLPEKVDDCSISDWERLFHIGFGALEYIQENFNETTGKSVSFVASPSPCTLSELGDRYERLKRTAIATIGTGKQMIVKVRQDRDADAPDAPSPLLLQAGLKRLETNLELRKPEQYFETLNGLTDAILRSSDARHDLKPELYYGLATALMRFINENHLTDSLANSVDFNALLTDRPVSWEQAISKLYEASGTVFDVLGDPKNKNNEALHKIVLYIERNLDKDLTLNRLAEIGCFNPSYLSRIFKQTYGSNLSEHIIKQRMELAKQLLRTTPKRISEISAEAGYASHHSFTRVFKQIVGMSPIEYRDKYGEFA